MLQMLNPNDQTKNSSQELSAHVTHSSPLLWCHRLLCVTPFCGPRTAELWLHRPDSLTRWHTRIQKYPAQPTLPWTREPPGRLRWGQSGAGWQQVQTPAARWGRQDERSAEPWSESEKRSSAPVAAARWISERWLNSGQVGKSVWRLPAGRALSQPACGSRFTCCLPPVLHFTWASKAWPEFMSPAQQRAPPWAWVLPSSASEWKQLQGYLCHGGNYVFLFFLPWPELVLLIHIQRLFRVQSPPIEERGRKSHDSLNHHQRRNKV